MATITCKIPEKLAARLSAAARAERRSKSAVVREALEDRLKARRKRGSVSGYDLAGHLCGALKGGRSDLATNPAHMKGFGE
jgi:metal-responsive CopG/Arc/MetJ family transcriptional regulator